MASKNFVLDTNVLIENPKCIQALRNGQDNNIHIPYTVLTELDKLKRDPRLGHVVAQAVTTILSDPSVHIFPPGGSALPLATDESPDDRILREVSHHPIHEPILVTNDRILQLKARVSGIPCEGYRDSVPFQSESQIYTGFVEEDEDPVPNSFRWEAGTPVFYGPDGPKPIGYNHEIWGLKPRTVYQNLALELMRISVAAPCTTRKSAFCAAYAATCAPRAPSSSAPARTDRECSICCGTIPAFSAGCAPTTAPPAR